MSELTILILALLYAAIAWRSLPYALAVLIVTLPVYQLRFSVGPIPSTVLEAMILILFGAWLIRSWQNRELPGVLRKADVKYLRHYPFWRETIVLLIIAFVSAGVAGFSNDALGLLKAYFIEPVMVFIVTVNICKHERNRPLIFGAIAVSVLWVSLVAWYQFFTGDLVPFAWQGTGRMTGPFSYPNALGLYVGPLIPLLIGWAVSLWRARRGDGVSLAFVITVLVAFGAIILVRSDGAIAGVMAALALMGLLYSKKTRIVVAVMGAVAILGIALAPPAIQAKLYKKVAFQDLDGQIRLMLWQETGAMLTAGPARFIFGAGLAGFQEATRPYHVEGIFYNRDNLPEFHRKVVFNEGYRQKYWQPVELYLYPHMVGLNFWSELGLAGLAAMVWLIGHYTVTNVRAWRRSDAIHAALHLGLLGAMVVIIVHGLVDVPYFKNDLAVLFWLLCAMSGVLGIQIPNNKFQIPKKFQNVTNK